ncbi:uncharacterized protein BCR38DRAFT_478996 [Pseudomassariella vexata]|uniref:Uncharacterized protein n=1 Tax=Pseudomassariella vexata TaxID=1141098 RepID=A0A1Y2D9M6_9PEZI|nr:uncharacterized protein BCR38DRAFT_478996 [Pseudomassariella vexata]ORY55917.1 hypothetical protein BCR38DRAFT_478996 [Pseudomassariella vexata]
MDHFQADDPNDPGCSTASIGLPGWPTIGNSQYAVWLDSSPIDEGCQLIFYNPPPPGDQSGFKAPASSQDFGQIHCCGDECAKFIVTKREEEPASAPAPAVRTLPAASDITQIKRAPLMGHNVPVKRNTDCTFPATDGKTQTRYGAQVKVGAQVDCPTDSKLGCPMTGEYTAGTTVGTTDKQTTSVSGGGGFFGFLAAVGHDWSHSNNWQSQTSFSKSYSLTIDAGDSGYFTFMPKLTCATGSFSGDQCEKARLVGDDLGCIPALIAGDDGRGEPDGILNTVLVN